MVNALLVTLLVTLGVTALTYLWDQRATLPTRVAVGLVAGTTLLGLLGYALSSRFGLTSTTVWLPTLLLALPLALFLRPEYRRLLRRDIRRMRPRPRSASHRMAALAWFLAAAAVVYFLVGAVYDRDGGYWTTNHFNHGDLPWHFGIIQGFALGANFPPLHPEFAGARLTYPFLADFVAAQYLVVGASMTEAFRIQNLTLALSLVTILSALAVAVTRNRYATLIAPALTIFNGGWAWFLLVKYAQKEGKSLPEVLQYLPFDVTRNDDETLKWGNLLTVLAGTQRGFLMALPLALAVYVLLWQGFRRDDRMRLRTMLGAGFLTGIMPLIHGHSFLVLFLSGAALACYDIPRAKERWLGWLSYFGVATLVALPQLLVLASGTAVDSQSFFGIEAGWDSGAKDFWTFCAFWYRNTGPLFPLVLLALLWRGSDRWREIPLRQKQFFVPFFLCFLLGNIVRLAPWIWDNMKVLYYFQIGTSLLIAALLSRLNSRGVFGKLLAALLFFLCILAGGLDAYRMASGQTAAEVYSHDGVIFGQRVAEATPPSARIITAPLHTHPVLLSGRRELHGFGGHLISHGFKGEVLDARMNDIKKVYSGDPDADNALRRLDADYIALGPPERNEENFHINDNYLAQFPVVVEVGPYRLLKVR